jgi:hypothetical protein
MSLLRAILRILFPPTTYTDSRGYRRFSDSGRSVHRWAASKKLGRILLPGEVVHHRNRKKSDNSFSNLRVFPSWMAHDKVHRKDLKKTGKW